MKKLIFPILLGVAGVAVLVSLGVWQMQRLAWKEGVLTDIGAQISQDPVAIPATPNPTRDKFLSVRAEGEIDPNEIHLLVSQKQVGAGYRIVQPFVTQGRRIMIDRGFIALADKDSPRAVGHGTITGNLHWPDEVDGYTPDPDVKKNIWFARDVPRMAAALNTEPVLLVVRDMSPADPSVSPLPVDTSGIPNDHLEYAMTWFSLALVWFGMTAFLCWRIARPTTSKA